MTILPQYHCFACGRLSTELVPSRSTFKRVLVLDRPRANHPASMASPSSSQTMARCSTTLLSKVRMKARSGLPKSMSRLQDVILRRTQPRHWIGRNFRSVVPH
jgi:hypothetical protein